MGEAAEQMARRNEISRAEQDAFALRSHQRAAAAIAAGRLDKEIVPVAAKGVVGGHGKSANGDGWVHTDTIVRGDTSLEKLAKLKPAFARDGFGTVTAGSSSPLTDGAASVLLMSEEKAAALGVTALARVTRLVLRRRRPCRSAAHRAGAGDAARPRPGGPGARGHRLRRPARGLRRAGSVGSQGAGQRRLRARAPGRVRARSGWSIRRASMSTAARSPSAIRSAATGARMVTTMAHELHDTGKATALLGICAQGGLGAAALLENAGAG